MFVRQIKMQPYVHARLVLQQFLHYLSRALGESCHARHGAKLAQTAQFQYRPVDVFGQPKIVGANYHG
jgi:hypothetical protein